ncbi:MAG: rhomboid family intramembrane serine protease [Pseudomonadota bacterium]
MVAFVAEVATGGPARWGLSAHALMEGKFATIATHMFSHAGPAHLLMNATALPGFAGPVVRRLGWRASGIRRFALFFGLSGLAAAICFLLLNPNGSTPMVGASGAICGLWGACMRLAPAGEGGIRPIRDRAILRELGAFAVSNVVLFAVLYVLSGGVGGLAWEAHLGGLLFGLLAFPLFVEKRVEALAVENKGEVRLPDRPL